MKDWIIRVIKFLSTDPTPPQSIVKVEKGKDFPFYFPHKGLYFISSRIISYIQKGEA